MHGKMAKHTICAINPPEYVFLYLSLLSDAKLLLWTTYVTKPIAAKGNVTDRILQSIMISWATSGKTCNLKP